MNKLELFIAKTLRERLIILRDSAPQLQDYVNIPEFLEILWEDHEMRKSLYNNSVGALKTLASKNGIDIQKKREKQMIDSDIKILCDWSRGEMKREWFGPDSIPGVSIELGPDLVVMHNGDAKKPKLLAKILGAGYQELKKMVREQNQDVILFFGDDYFSDNKIAGIAGGQYAIIIATGNLEADVYAGLHELGHRLLSKSATYEIFDDMRMKIWLDFPNSEKADRVVDEISMLEEAFVEHITNEMLGLSSHLEFFDRNVASRYSEKLLRTFLEQNTRKFRNHKGYSIIASLFQFLCFKANKEPLDFLTYFFKISKETMLYPWKTIESILAQKRIDIIKEWASVLYEAQSSFFSPAELLIAEIFEG